MFAKRWAVAIGALALGCTPAPQTQDAAPAGGAPAAGLAGVKDDASAKDVVKIAAGSPDHTTLVAAVGAAGLTDVLASSGPYTVFAPTNAAFDKLPKGTVDDLLKPENKSKLQAILRHHVTTSVYLLEELKDGMVLGMADGSSATIAKKGADTYLGDAKIIGSARGSNGMVHIVDAIVLPPSR
ncbi:MAG: fasciclin domain-containing protein [Gemmatimonadetes bacterium]|nr:fasciclin domain-containing protein [Gemmatimonadota bacterium]